MGGTSLERTHCLFWTHSKLSTATQRPWIYSRQRGMGQVQVMYSLSLSLQETAHHGLGLREFHTSQGYSVLGSTLTQPRGEINTPAGPRKCVRMCASTLVNVQACTHTRVCTHSCVSSMTHIPIFLLLRKLVDSGMCWYLGGVLLQVQLLWPKTKCHWLSNAFHGTTSVLSITTNSDFVVCSLYNDSFPKNCNISLGLQYYL